MKAVPTVGELKAHCAQVRLCLERSSALGEYPLVELLAAVEGLPSDVTFCTTDLLDQVVSRALVEEAYRELESRPSSSTCVCEGWGCRRCLKSPAGMPRALALLKEALG